MLETESTELKRWRNDAAFMASKVYSLQQILLNLANSANLTFASFFFIDHRSNTIHACYYWQVCVLVVVLIFIHLKSIFFFFETAKQLLSEHSEWEEGSKCEWISSFHQIFIHGIFYFAFAILWNVSAPDMKM